MQGFGVLIINEAYLFYSGVQQLINIMGMKFFTGPIELLLLTFPLNPYRLRKHPTYQLITPLTALFDLGRFALIKNINYIFSGIKTQSSQKHRSEDTLFAVNFSVNQL